MPRFRALPLLAACSLIATAPPALPAGATDVAAQSTVTKATLGNGLRVVVVQNDLAPVVSTDLVYLVGSRDDPQDVPGMAHAQEHMMFRGTKNLSTSELGTLATALGGNFNAETSDTLTQFEFTVPAPELDAVLRVESDRMRDVLDAQNEWQTERGAIEQEVLRDDTTPGADFFRDARSFAFAGTTYAHDGVGTRAAFDRLTGPQLKAFWDKWYAPNNAVLVIAGDVDAQATIALVKERFDGVPHKNVPAHAVAKFQPLKRTILRRPSTLVYPLAVVGFRMPGVDDPDFLPSFLLQQTLDSARGPLHTLVDTGEALDASWLSMPYFPEAQLGFATAALRPGADPMDEAAHLESILHKIAVDGIPKELFETTRRHAIADQELSRNSIASLAGDWATTIALDGEPSIEKEQQLLAGVTLADVNRAAKRLLDPEHAIIGALTPSPNANRAEAPSTGPTGPEKPLDTQQPVTHLPDWAGKLLTNVPVPPSRLAPVSMTLDNGITLVVAQESISDSVFVYGDVHSNHFLQEPQGKEGVSGVLATLFDYGSASRDRNEFLRAADDLDSGISAGARFGLQTTPRTFDASLALLGEAELHPRFEAEAFDNAKRRTVQELQTLYSGTQSVISRAIARRLLPEGDPELREANPDVVNGFTVDDVRAYYEKTFRPDETTMVVIGNVTPQAAKAAVEKVFGDWKASGPKPELELAAVPVNSASAFKLTPPSAEQDTVELQEMLATNRSDPAYAPLEVGNAILGGGSTGPEQSRLFRDIRQNAGLAYSIGSDVAFDTTRARFTVSYACLPSNEDRIAKLVSSQVDRMRTEPAGTFELSLAKASIVRRAILDDAAVASIGEGLLDAAADGMPLDQNRRDAAAFAAVDAASIRDAFAKYVQPDRFVHLVVGP